MGASKAHEKWRVAFKSEKEVNINTKKGFILAQFDDVSSDE